MAVSGKRRLVMRSGLRLVLNAPLFAGQLCKAAPEVSPQSLLLTVPPDLLPHQCGLGALTVGLHPFFLNSNR